MSTNKLRATFKHSHVILPVIHVLSFEQAYENAQIAFEAGADGVFLINHEDESGKRPLSHIDLTQIHHQLRPHFPNWWLGVNFLDLKSYQCFAHNLHNIDGVWVDNSGIHEVSLVQKEAEQITAVRQKSGWHGLYFGGVAFKYQQSVKDVAGVAKTAIPYMDIITTSGSGTGKAAPLEKIKTMRTAIGEHPLAIASGLTPENANDYLPYVNCFLIATGISHSFYEFDPKRMEQFVTAVREGSSS